VLLNNDIHTLLQQGRLQFGATFFTEIFIIAAWEIWNLRNAKIFEGQAASLQLWTVKFKDQILLQLHRVSEDLRPTIVQWLSTTL
jgi:hypothetical protein